MTGTEPHTGGDADLSRAGLTEAEAEILRCVVGRMIPASAEFGVPGADDPAIFGDILANAGRDLAALRRALQAIAAMAGEAFATLGAGAQDEVLARFRKEQPALSGSVETLTALSYYRDDRVMRAIGMEVRPPYPKGYEVEQGDWSLLEPVRARGRIYRDVERGGDR